VITSTFLMSVLGMDDSTTGDLGGLRGCLKTVTASRR